MYDYIVVSTKIKDIKLNLMFNMPLFDDKI